MHLAQFVRGSGVDVRRSDQTIESTIAKRHRIGRGRHRRDAVAMEEPKLAEVEIHADSIVEALGDDPRAASYMQGPIAPARPRGDAAVPAPAQQASNESQGVEHAFVVVG